MGVEVGVVRSVKVNDVKIWSDPDDGRLSVSGGHREEVGDGRDWKVLRGVGVKGEDAGGVGICCKCPACKWFIGLAF